MIVIIPCTKNDSISLSVEDILPWVTVEWLLEPLLVKSVPVNPRNIFAQKSEWLQNQKLKIEKLTATCTIIT